MSRSLLHILSSRSCIVSSLTFTSFNLFYMWCKVVVQFISFEFGCTVFSAPFIEETVFFPIVYSWLLCHQLFDHIWIGLFLGSLFFSFDLYIWFYANTILFGGGDPFFNAIFKGYFPFIVITNYQLYSLCCTICLWAFLIPIVCASHYSAPLLMLLSLLSLLFFLFYSLICCVF